MTTQGQGDDPLERDFQELVQLVVEPAVNRVAGPLATQQAELLSAVNIVISDQRLVKVNLVSLSDRVSEFDAQLNRLKNELGQLRQAHEVAGSEQLRLLETLIGTLTALNAESESRSREMHDEIDRLAQELRQGRSDISSLAAAVGALTASGESRDLAARDSRAKQRRLAIAAWLVVVVMLGVLIALGGLASR